MSTPTNSAAPAATSAPTETLVSKDTTSEAIESQENIEATDEAADESAEQEEVVEEKASASKDSKTTKEEKQASNKKKLKLKVDGEEFEEEFDFGNEAELIKQLQLAKVSQKRMNEFAQLRKEVEFLMQGLKDDPENVMRQLGIDPEEFSVKTLQKKLEDEQKSPEQKEREALQKELEELRAKNKKEEEDRKLSERTRLQQEHAEKIESSMINALEKQGLQQKPLVVKRMAEAMLVALDNGIDLSVDDVAPVVKKELEQDMKDYISVLPDEAIEMLLGKDRLVGMRKKQIAAVKKAADTANSVKVTGNAEKAKKEAADKKVEKTIPMRDFLKL